MSDVFNLNPPSVGGVGQDLDQNGQYGDTFDTKSYGYVKLVMDEFGMEYGMD